MTAHHIGMGSFAVWHWIVVLAIVLVVFGVGLPGGPDGPLSGWSNTPFFKRVRRLFKKFFTWLPTTSA